jgi:hypothetical protein
MGPARPVRVSGTAIASRTHSSLARRSLRGLHHTLRKPLVTRLERQLPLIGPRGQPSWHQRCSRRPLKSEWRWRGPTPTAIHLRPRRRRPAPHPSALKSVAARPWLQHRSTHAPLGPRFLVSSRHRVTDRSELLTVDRIANRQPFRRPRISDLHIADASKPRHRRTVPPGLRR